MRKPARSPYRSTPYLEQDGDFHLAHRRRRPRRLVGLPNADGTRLSYEDLLPRAVDATYGPDRLVVHIAALDDITASKQWANRPKDNEALPELQALRDSQRAERPGQLG